MDRDEDMVTIREALKALRRIAGQYAGGGMLDDYQLALAGLRAADRLSVRLADRQLSMFIPVALEA